MHCQLGLGLFSTGRRQARGDVRIWRKVAAGGVDRRALEWVSKGMVSRREMSRWHVGFPPA